MKSHIKIYMDAFGYDLTDFRPCEISGQSGVDIHHINCKGMGGNPSKDKDRIENLMALSREDHLKYGDKTKYKGFLFRRHKRFMQFSGVAFDEDYINNQIEKYN